ncbi:LamG domain-containing protein [Candidatus Amarolinea dominans]|uniref:LamG domain-containing protein n=1 Tax=Candidatus Amarolinea dominans TaxID=3140696 RepID=UPI001D383C81|nr:LamG domain-containing protein [Anaerolineae bacterium]
MPALECGVSGLGDYLELPMAGDISTQGWTFSSWLFLESDKAQILYANGVADFYLDGSVLTLRNVGEALKCEPSVTRNQWVHVAVAVQASGDASVWIDGRLAGQGNIGAATLPDPAVWRVGRYADDDTNWIFTGNLAHVRLYGKALSTAEIQRQRLARLGADSGLSRQFSLGVCPLGRAADAGNLCRRRRNRAQADRGDLEQGCAQTAGDFQCT